MKRIGILLADDGDLRVNDQGIVLGDTGIQNQYLILIAQKGEIKEHPTLGIAVNEMLGDEDTLWWNYQIRSEFEKDDIQVEKVEIDLNTGKLTIIAQ